MKEKFNLYLMIFTKWFFIAVGLVGFSLVGLVMLNYTLQEILNFGINGILITNRISGLEFVKGISVGIILLLLSISVNLYLLKKKELEYFKL